MQFGKPKLKKDTKNIIQFITLTLVTAKDAHLMQRIMKTKLHQILQNSFIDKKFTNSYT